MAEATSSPCLFKQESGRYNTVLNWYGNPQEEFRLYGEAFWNAANKLAESDDVDSGGFSDFAACPIVYLYRHALELYLKAILIEDGGKFISPRPDPAAILAGNHSLRKFLPGVRRIFKELGWEDGRAISDDSSLDEWEKIVNELEEIDPGSFTFRYPVNKQLGGSVPSRFTFSAREFACRMDDVLDMLDTACFGLSAESDLRERYGDAG